MSKLWCMRFVHIFLTDVGSDCLQWPAQSGNWLFCTGYWLYKLSMKWLMCWTLFLHISNSLGCFWPRTIFTKKDVLDKLPRTSSTWDLRTILKINSREVPGLATDSPCGVWGRGWTTCLLYDGPLLGLGFYLSVGVNIWYSAEVVSLDFLPLFMFYTLPMFCLIFSPP